MNHQLEERLKGIRKILKAHYDAGLSLPAAAKGAEREVLVKEFLSKVFPAPYRFGCGAVTNGGYDHIGSHDVNRSALESDLVILKKISDVAKEERSSNRDVRQRAGQVQ